MKGLTKSDGHDQLPLSGYALKECDAMVRYALSSGLEVPETVLQMLRTARDQRSPEDERMLIRVHNKLAKIVSPKTPRTIVILEIESADSFWNFLGPVKLIRRMMFVTILFLISFIALSVSSYVDGKISLNDCGPGVLLNELFFISAAGIGATFSGLFRVNKYIERGTYDPKHEASYWIMIGLGIVAGLVLTMLIPFDISEQASMKFEKPLLALLGGFSAPAVHTILQRLVYSVESLVSGESNDLITTQEHEAEARFAAQLAQNRLKMAMNLMKLKKDLKSEGGQGERLDERFDQIFNDLLDQESHEIQEESQRAGGTTEIGKDQELIGG